MGRPGTPMEILISIDSIHRSNPKSKAKEIRNELIHRFKDKLPENRIPKERRIQMEIHRLKSRDRVNKNLQNKSKLDRRWSLGSLVEWPYMKDIAPLLLHLQENGFPYEDFEWTNRQVLWMYRLSATVFREFNLEQLQLKDVSKPELAKTIDVWFELAINYSLLEQVWETLKRPSPVDTHIIDASTVDKMLEKYKHWSAPWLKEAEKRRRKGKRVKVNERTN